MASTVKGAVTPGHATSAAPGFSLTDISLIGMAVIWGVNYSIVKYGASVLDPLAFNCIRIVLAAAGLAVVMRATKVTWPSGRTALSLLALGALGNGLYQVLFIEGIARTRAGDAALMLAASPVFIAVIGRLRGVERMPARAITGILLSICGIALVVFGSTQAHGASGRATLLGDALIVTGSLSWALYTVLLKPLTHDVDGIPLSALTMVGGAIPLLLVASPALATTRWTAVPMGAWAALTYSSVLALVIAYLFYYRGIRVIGPTRTAMYGNLQPLVAVIVAWITLGEVPTQWQGFGAACIMVGLVLSRT